MSYLAMASPFKSLMHYIFLLFTYLPFISPKLMSHLLRPAAWPTESKFYVRVRMAGQISLFLFLPWYDLEHLKKPNFYYYVPKGNACSQDQKQDSKLVSDFYICFMSSLNII